MKILVSNPRFIEWESFVEEPWNLHLLKYFPDDFDAPNLLQNSYESQARRDRQITFYTVVFIFTRNNVDITTFTTLPVFKEMVQWC